MVRIVGFYGSASYGIQLILISVKDDGIMIRSKRGGEGGAFLVEAPVLMYVLYLSYMTII